MKVLAVSGGIDSVTMLDYLVRNYDEELVVAHFDHGIRQNSHEDADFVEKLAAHYGLPFEKKRVELGANCSEATARTARYEFLNEVAQRYNASICVAHHSDDIIESIAINIIRGTGWRCLAPMQNSAIERPLLNWTKAEIYHYATEHGLHFRQDPTNVEDEYLRNRVRMALRNCSAEQKAKLLELYWRQADIKTEIDEILSILPTQSRYDKSLATETEILRAILARFDIHLTRPQLANCQNAIVTYSSGKLHSLDKSHFIKVHKYSFEIV